MSDPAWKRVTRSVPCQVCGKADWCLVSADGTAAICPRTESPKRAGDAGWLHRLAGDGGRVRPRRRVLRLDPPPGDLTALAERYRRAAAPDRLAGLAASLGVSVEALAALRVGWSADHLAWSFPMSDPVAGRVVGIHLRAPGGSKFAVKGGKEGLFLPAADPAPAAPLLVAEGPTDTAALLDLGFPNVVGRPSCTGGTKHLVALVRALRPAGVVIVSDADEPGRHGARNLTSVLVVHVPAVRMVEPPAGVKDVRAWARAGATRADVEQLVQAAPARRLTITTLRGDR
ncbi:MAG: hypothetical protein C0501_06980 [Isosphaera sp.]|nr:hypothetical protein [Isosphaera sp.]